MLFSSNFVLTLVASAVFVASAPLPARPRLGMRRIQLQASRREALERLQARGPISAYRRTPQDSSSSTDDSTAVTAADASASSSTDPAFLDACINDVIDWAVSKLVSLFDEPSSAGPNVSTPAALPSDAPLASGNATDPSSDPSSDSAASASAATSAPLASASAAATGNSTNADDGSGGSSTDAPSARRSLNLDPALNAFRTKIISKLSHGH
ncbi:hypothetical protein DFH07DRAFT_1030323 [Mycena maculata]|uniref:Uncharacterized protein n=1 Tax=Mycena maculata TaxID=230809 RepID=A0AAD7K6T0_9AGAR|nr:hypothetical protein DFH07DRAFT_1030323 [Mycena maculata]